MAGGEGFSLAQATKVNQCVYNRPDHFDPLGSGL